MEKIIEQLGYTVTTDTSFFNKQYNITSQLNFQLGKLHGLAINGKASSEQKLLNIINTHPTTPHLKTYLSTFYRNIGEEEKAKEVNHRLSVEHPNYLFGKLNLAADYLEEENYAKVPELLCNAMELKALYPHRDLFHINEFTSFYSLAIKYFILTGDIEQAERRLNMMEKVAPDEMETEEARYEFMMAEPTDDFDEEIPYIKVDSRAESSTAEEPPTFNHPEIEELYTYDTTIDPNLISTILSLPRQSVIEDLEKVLEDSINRFNHFNNLALKVIAGEDLYFAIHAICLLGDLHAEESLPTIVELLSQHDQYYNLFFDDFITEVLWEPVYKIAFNQLDTCKDFMKQPGKYTYAKNVFIQVVEQIPLHHPERKEEVINWLTDIINFYVECQPDDNIIDEELNAFIIKALVDIMNTDALPIIKPLFDKDIVDAFPYLSYSDIEEDAMHNRGTRFEEILDTRSRYKQINETLAEMNEMDFFSDEEMEDWHDSSIPIVKENKTGRNDPCPCGSGKKYKKCCLDK